MARRAATGAICPFASLRSAPSPPPQGFSASAYVAPFSAHAQRPIRSRSFNSSVSASVSSSASAGLSFPTPFSSLSALSSQSPAALPRRSTPRCSANSPRLTPLFGFRSSYASRASFSSDRFSSPSTTAAPSSAAARGEHGREGDQAAEKEFLRRVEAAASRLREEAEKKRRDASEAEEETVAQPQGADRHAPPCPSSVSSSSWLCPASSAGGDGLIDKGVETLPAGPESTFIDVGFRVEKLSHFESAMHQLQSTLLLLLHGAPREGPMKRELQRAVAKSYLDMAMLAHQHNKLDEAADAYRRALSFYAAAAREEKAPAEVAGRGEDGESSLTAPLALDIANCLSCLSVVEADRGSVEKALGFLEKSMQWKVALLNGVPLAPLLAQLQGARDPQPDAPSRAVDTIKRIPLQPESLFFDTMNSLGGIYLRQGDVRKSALALRFAVECLYRLGELYTGQRFAHLGRTSSPPEAGAVASPTLAELFGEGPLGAIASDASSSDLPGASMASSLPSPAATASASRSVAAAASPSSDARAPCTFSYFLTALCEHINSERRALYEEARRAVEREEEKKKQLRRLQLRQMESQAGIVPADRGQGFAEGGGEKAPREEGMVESEAPAHPQRSEASEEARDDLRGLAVAAEKDASQRPARSVARSRAESLLPYGTIVFYNLGQSLLSLGQRQQALEALEKAEALAELAQNSDLQRRVAALVASLRPASPQA
ncbi:tetratricopeptide repeat-containing protein [Besnoitia besnoiti]|uniref:Tetratricopeptide repeat-containing protein n=1 Tax=Besnoitia besnoiti TaxID=94643 RepID=A0A2A9MH51_BESBE|nr:tetratricopeptide repeat-containing protein [Besnoitia besnoiti]PFH34732.1 tetratricopeptide repeat-containing protein [Besnoitia besnoiti]